MGEKEWKADPMLDPKGYLEPNQVKAILIKARDRGLRDFLIISLLATTGRRVSEVLALRVNDIQFDKNAGYFHILKKRMKDGKQRVDGKLKDKWKKRKEIKLKPIPANLIPLLAQYIKSEYLLDEERVFRITRQRVFQIVRECAREAGIEFIGENRKGVHPHHFRHSFAVNNVKRKMPLKLIQQALEHSSLNMTSEYLKFDISDQRNAVEDLY